MRIRGIYSLVLLSALAAVCRAEPIEIPAASGVISPPFQVVGNAIIQTNDTTIEEGGKAIYNFTITNSGDYTIHAAVAGRSGKISTLKVCLGAETQDPNALWQFDASETVKRRPVGSKRNITSNRNYAVFSIPAGTHQLLVRGATGGLKIEKLYIVPHAPPAGPESMRLIRN